jgi:acetoin:2,6-dichlorophenolindophenol oxidoreductase subunit alpha
MHLFDPPRRFSCSGIVAAGAPQACGAALAYRQTGSDRVAVAFFGEGAANQGAFHEALNLAALWKLPVLFVVEDNRWGISVAKAASTAVPFNHVRAAGYGMPGVLVEHNDPVAVFEAAGHAVARARRGDGPTLIEVVTDRLFGHFQGDPETYRPKDEVASLRAQDPIPALAARLQREGLLDDAAEAALTADVQARVAAAFRFARDSAEPTAAEATMHVFAEETV